MIRYITLLSTFVLLVACTIGSVPDRSTTTIIMLRHADRADRVLNSTGEARARALPGALSDFDIDAIFSPDLTRNLQTAEPLSKETGISVTIMPDEFAAARMPRAYPTGTVVWVGNKGNLRSLWEAYSAPGAPPLEYGDIGIVTLKQGKSEHVERRRFEPAKSQ